MKRNVILKTLLLVSILILAVYGNSSSVYAWTTVKYTNISYDENPLYLLKKLDIYALENASNRPVIIYVHGGAWKIGDKSLVDSKPAYFNSLGCIFVSINYRLVPGISFPDNAYDVAQAFSWVKDHIQEYGGDASKIVVMGHSAGAHLATLVSTDKKYLNYYGKSPDIITVNISVDTAAYDLPEVISISNPIEVALYEGAFGTDPAVWEEASPINFVKRGGEIPEMLLLYSDLTKMGALSYLFASELAGAAIKVDVVGSLDDTHDSINTSIGEPGSVATQAIINFLRAYK